MSRVWTCLLRGCNSALQPLQRVDNPSNFGSRCAERKALISTNWDVNFYIDENVRLERSSGRHVYHLSFCIII